MLTLLLSTPGLLLYAGDSDPTSLDPDSVSAEQAAIGESECLDRTLIDNLLNWVEANTSYDVSQTRIDPPTIRLCTMGEIIDYEGTQIMVDAGLSAAFDSKHRRINIVGPWNPLDIRDQSVLLHELVHDVQLLNRDWYCLQQPEWEAYKLQDAWLQEQGLNSGFDWLYIYFLSRCPRDHHP